MDQDQFYDLVEGAQARFDRFTEQSAYEQVTNEHGGIVGMYSGLQLGNFPRALFTDDDANWFYRFDAEGMPVWEQKVLHVFISHCVMLEDWADDWLTWQLTANNAQSAYWRLNFIAVEHGDVKVEFPAPESSDDGAGGTGSVVGVTLREMAMAFFVNSETLTARRNDYRYGPRFERFGGAKKYDALLNSILEGSDGT